LKKRERKRKIETLPAVRDGTLVSFQRLWETQRKPKKKKRGQPGLALGGIFYRRDEKLGCYSAPAKETEHQRINLSPPPTCYLKYTWRPVLFCIFGKARDKSWRRVIIYNIGLFFGLEVETTT
jgi:hypothetical protein